MKQFVLMAFVVAVAIGCNDSGSTVEGKKADTTASATVSTEKFDYPYTLERPYREWQIGDMQHAVNVMKSLKAFEAGDIDNCITAFGDSVTVRFDYYHARLSNDSLKKQFIDSRGKLAALKINMQDWESVISKDKQTEYVTLWYKETSTDKKGKTDSISVVDDLRIQNGKIVELDQKIQHFPAKKK